jgi:hypothetical protein
MRETWYMLESGEVVSPSKVVSDAKGKLFCDGVAVAMKGDVPHTTGVDVDAVKAPMINREVTAEVPKRTYKTRGSK